MTAHVLPAGASGTKEQRQGAAANAGLAEHELRLLRQIAGDRPLADVLEDLCRTLEAVSPRPLRAAVMLADGECLKCIAAPGLPPAFRSDRDATRLEGSGTACAEAVRSGREAIVADTAAADVSAEIAALHGKWGIRAVWSYPIVQDGETLGTLALLAHSPGEPDAGDERMIDFALQIARLALAHQRKNAALLASEQRFRDYAELSADWFWEQDAELRFTTLLPGSGRGSPGSHYAPSETIGRLRWELPYTDMPDSFWEAHRRLLAARRPFSDLHIRYRTPDGQLRHSLISGKPVFDETGAFAGYRGTGREITEQVAAQDKLEKTRRWLEQAVRAAGIGLWERDVDAWTFHMTSNWKTLFGYSGDEIANTTEEIDRLIHPDDLARVQAVARAYAANPQGDYENRFRIRHKDGSWHWVLSRGSVQADPVTGRQSWMGCHLDITEQKRAEQQIADLAATLEARVRARTAALEEANRELDAFNFSVSHDLRTPLRAIEGFSQILLEDYAERLDETGRGFLQRIGAATMRMSELIGALHDLSRLGRAQMHLRPLDLSALARELADGLRAGAPEREVEIDIAATPAAEGDARLLRIVLHNLLANAWKYTAKTSRARIAFGAGTDARGRCVYSVSDNGAGFDMRFADKLFRMFHRLHREEEFGGQGVGLTTAQRILARHGGRIWAEAALGAGATFFFTLWDEADLRSETPELEEAL